MQISLRSHMIAGTAAVVGASAIALTPVVAQHEMLPNIQVPSAAALEVSLAGFDSPISELFKTVAQATNFIFSADDTAYPFIAVAAYVQPPSPYNFSANGIIPQIINDHLPIISQLGYNGSAYLNSTLNAVASIGNSLSEGVWNAAGDLLSFDIPGAISTLLGAVQDAGMTALQAGQYVLNNVVKKASTLLAATPALVNLVIDSAIGQAQVLLGTVLGIVDDVTNAGSIEGSWNALVDGLFGPTRIGGVKPSLPGAINALTIGAGVSTGVAPGDVVPSVRGVIQAAVNGVATALKATAPTPSPVSPPTAATKSVASSAAAARRAVAPSVAAVSSDNGGSDNGGSKAAKPSRSKDGGSSNSRAAKSSKD